MRGRNGPTEWVNDDFIDRDANTATPLEMDPWHPVGYRGSSSQVFSEESVPRESETVRAATVSWETEDLRDDGFTDQWANFSVDTGDWAEPEPTVEPASSLNESLYPPDYTITDISRDLKIGELLAFVSPCTRIQHTRCHELLSACSVGRLRRLIPWLRNRSWCGDKLQLFLEFRDLWESPGNSHWWEVFYWDYWGQTWIPNYFYTTLTLEHARELVEWRAGRVFTEVIDGRWFDDWEDYAAWELGIRSFASFAVFRAGIPDSVRWWEYLGQHDRRTSLEFAQYMDIDTNPWTDLTDMANRRAAALGGNLAQAWEEIMDEMTGY